ncbi:hypothetical protein [Sphingobacterium sp. DR205]|uniref:AbiTii domain-containing protein n=1 Tax=Sphingobacterium sp. DR205 TaxID=2713573 RepID=UPI0013E42F82|nr:hypothetical protein [Sphingobacterium sp. DR205]QIH33880.1 hypothetical protein G6053_13745 [Sphingobacterium sp. DR205]
MIKELIEDLTFDKITVTQALTRAKIIAYKVKNNDFKDWIYHEINGYTDGTLPSYRVIKCEVFADVYHPFRGTTTVPFDVTNLDKDLNSEMSFYKMRITQSVGTLESNLNASQDQNFGFELLPQGLVTTLSQMSGAENEITAVKRRIQFSELRHILELTKQKLLDTLLELNDAFPDFENSFSKEGKDSEQRVQTIINQNIYGNNTNSNIGIGENIEQNFNSTNTFEKLSKELKNIGVEETDIGDLKKLIENEPKENLSKKILGWVGKIATKAIEKGVELQVPLLIEVVNRYI